MTIATTTARFATFFLFGLLGMLLGFAAPARGQASDLFFSEYVEGSSFNKALELYNGTGASVDLAAEGYQIEMYFNGNTSAGTTVPLTGVVDTADVYVVADDGADAAILAVADETSAASFFNGDDAIVLRKGGNGGAIVDVIGQVGFDPGSEWSGGGIGTQNETLRRTAMSCVGDTDPDDAFDPSIEWMGFAEDTFDGLGTHTANCDGPPPPPTAAEIYEIQGNGAASPSAGQTVTTEDNVVTATAPDGFFMQTPTTRSDKNVDTSDGIFVFTDSAPGVEVGDLVDVTGEVIEFFDFTEFSNGPDVTVTGTGTLPAPVAFDSMTPSPDPTSPSCAIEFECYEGMLIQVSGGAVGGPNQFFGSDPTAEVHIVADGTRPFREPGIAYPGVSGLPVWDGNPDVFELDPDKLGLPNEVIPAGSSFDAVGVLGYEFGGYELWPSSLTVAPAAIPEPVRAVVPGESTVGSLNLFRLFDDVDDPADDEGRDDEVVSSEEYQRRLDKFSLYIRDVLGSPDILAVEEAEKLGVLEDLAVEIQAGDPAITYEAYLIEGNDIGTIDVGFLVRTDRVQVDSVLQLGADETFIDPTDNSVDILHDRPPLLLEGAFTGVGSQPQPIAVMVVHMRSLSGIETSARVRRKRLEQAQSVAQKVQDFQTANPDMGLVVTGDFNAFEFTDGYVDLVGRVKGDFDDSQDMETGPDLVDPNLTNQVLNLDPLERYSYIFNGSAQVLDHALTTAPLEDAVTGFEYGRGNADAAEILLDDETTALRATDHDGLVLFLELGETIATTDDVPSVHELAANYPNPFNSATTIEFALPEAATVQMNVYDVTGREVARLVDGAVAAGRHQVVFDADGLPGGVYFYQLTAPGFTQTRQMVVVK